MNDIEQLLRNLPKHRADSLFKDKLKQRILGEVTVQKPRFSWGFLPRLATVTLLLILVIGGLSTLNKQPENFSLTADKSLPESATRLFQAAPVSAAEIIEKHLANFFGPNMLYHLVYRHYVYNGTPDPQITTYDLREDSESDRFYQDITHSNGSRTTQGFDLKIRWEIQYASKQVYKDLYTFEPSAQGPQGRRLNEVAYFNDLINQGVLTTTQGEYDAKQVYVITDTRTGPEKSWDKLYFDRETFALIAKEEYKSDGTLEQKIVHTVEEVSPRTQENLNTYFTYKNPGSDFVIYARHFGPQGYVENEYYIESGTPQL